MNLAAITSTSEDKEESTGGLGYLDASQPILKLDLELVPPTFAISGMPAKVGSKGRSRRPVTAGLGREPVRIITVQLQQNLHLLKQSKGDTGRSSVLLLPHYNLSFR